MKPIIEDSVGVENGIHISQLQQDVNRFMGRINRDLTGFYDQFRMYGVPRPISQWIFLSIVTYVFRNAQDDTGSIERRSSRLLRELRGDVPLIFRILRGYGLQDNLIDSIFIEIITMILRMLGEEPEPGPGPGPGPGPRPTPGWSDWEDLGGVLTSAPAVSSWQPNRLDVFARGQNQALWHKWWDGSRWSQWEDLGGILTSAPAAVSWGRDRIDVFARGQNQSLWHKWWDGTRWSQWEDLRGGPLESGPAAASTGSDRLEVFARGPQNQLLFRNWNGNRWSSWRSLGGSVTSEPAAVSWGGRRIDVFARGQNDHLWHIWRP